MPYWETISPMFEGLVSHAEELRREAGL